VNSRYTHCADQKPPRRRAAISKVHTSKGETPPNGREQSGAQLYMALLAPTAAECLLSLGKTPATNQCRFKSSPQSVLKSIHARVAITWYRARKHRDSQMDTPHVLRRTRPRRVRPVLRERTVLRTGSRVCGTPLPSHTPPLRATRRRVLVHGEPHGAGEIKNS
jgi:hypothetical protein